MKRSKAFRLLERGANLLSERLRGTWTALSEISNCQSLFAPIRFKQNRVQVFIRLTRFARFPGPVSCFCVHVLTFLVIQHVGQ